jgi:RNA polymerase subunit RPABC4/transcription elongation factor Spt4
MNKLCLNCMARGKIVALHKGRCPECGSSKEWNVWLREREHPELMEVVQ